MIYLGKCNHSLTKLPGFFTMGRILLMKDFRNIYPPYAGKDPYIFLCFEAADAKYAEPILKRLWQRGCRIWYPLPGSSEVENQSLMEHAGLVVVMNTSQFAVSKAKRNMMFLQSKGVPIIVVDCIRGDVISTGEHAGTVHVSAIDGVSDSVETAIITAEGFSQDFIGQRPTMPLPSWVKVLLVTMAGLVVAAALFLALNISGIIRPTQDPSEVFTLTLDRIPDNMEELEKYPNLETVIIPQSEAGKAESLLDYYTVVLRKEK